MIKKFPEFSTITKSHRKEYEALVKSHPQLSDLSFPTLLIWWNFNGSLKMSLLNNNLVIAYTIPYDQHNSGLSLIGTNKVDQSVRTLFDFLKQKNQPTRLVHVPEFVVQALKHADEFVISEETDYKEYIIPISNLYPLEKSDHNFRRKVKKFVKESGENNINTKKLDLNREENKKILLKKAKEWGLARTRNDPEGVEQEVIPISINSAAELGMQNLCLYVNGELVGFQLYHFSQDGNYAIMNHEKISHELPRTSHYLHYVTAGEALKNGAQYLNMEMDLGIEGLRQHKSELRPSHYFQKYEIKPR